MNPIIAKLTTFLSMIKRGELVWSDLTSHERKVILAAVKMIGDKHHHQIKVTDAEFVVQSPY